MWLINFNSVVDWDSDTKSATDSDTDTDADSKLECKRARFKEIHRLTKKKEGKNLLSLVRVCVYSECSKISNAANKNGNDGAQSETFIK